MTESPERHDESIDALHAMADGQDAAAGSRPGEGQTEPPEESSSGLDSLTEQTAPGEDPQAAEDFSHMPRGEGASLARRNRSAAFQHQSRRVHAEQFKRAMIPLLIVVGAMLLLLGAAMLTMLPGAEQAAQARARGSDALAHKAWTRPLVLASFPLGAILFLGAWLFRRDLRAAGR